MGKKGVIVLVISLIITSAIVIPIAVIGYDIYMSISSFDPADVEVDVGNPTFEFSADNRTISYSVNVTITTPSLGFIPKSLTLNLQMYDADDNPIGDPLNSEFPIGSTKTETLSGDIALTDEMFQEIILGGSITLTIKGTVGVNYLGFEIVNLDLPPQTITIP
jgi:hypothetical protein